MLPETIIDQNQAQRIKDFNLYARFISEQFNISVCLNSHQANTDSKVINLPEVSDLTVNELDAMYGILLHEAGHIRHSSFDENYFSHFKTELHSFFANCFEDARIENLLCKDFAGSKDIFEKLYTVHAIDPEINYRLFGFHKRNGDDTFAFGAFLHNIKCDFSTAKIQDIDPNATKFFKVLSKNPEFIENLQKHPLITPDDTLMLSDIAMDFFTKYFKDKTKKISFQKDSEKLENTKNKIDEISKKIEDFSNKIKDIEKSISEKEEELKNYKLENFQDYDDKVSLFKTISNFNNNISKLNDCVQQHAKHQSSVRNTLTRAENTCDNYINRQKRIKDMMRDVLNAQKNIPSNQHILSEDCVENFEKTQQVNFLNNTNIHKELDSLFSKIENNLRKLHDETDTLHKRLINANTEINKMNNLKQDILNSSLDLKDNYSQLSSFENNELSPAIDGYTKTIEDFFCNQKDASIFNINNIDFSNLSNTIEQVKQSINDFSNQNIDALNNIGFNSDNYYYNKQKIENDSKISDLKNNLETEIAEIDKSFVNYEKAIKELKMNRTQLLSKEEQELLDSFTNDFNSKNTETYNTQVNIESPIDLLFQETPDWEDADTFQKEFDRIASKQTKSIVVNGAKIAGYGSGSRSILMVFDKLKKDVVNINLSEHFQKIYSGSIAEQYHSEGFDGLGSTKGEINNTEVYLAKIEQVGKHTIFTNQFDKIDIKNYISEPNQVNEAQEIVKSRPLITHLISQELKKKMKMTKKARYIGAKEEGDIDTRNLWKIAARKGSDVFEENNPRFINKVAASILIDISGSLNKDETKHGLELKFLSMALSNALIECKVNHEVLGYHAPYSTELVAQKIESSFNRRNHYLETVVFKNFKQKDNQAIDNLSIQSSDNSDGESLRIAVNRLVKERARNRILFMITDNKPFLEGSNILKLDKDLLDALRDAKRKKVQVIGIGFNKDNTGVFGKNYIHITNDKYEELILGLKNLNLKISD